MINTSLAASLEKYDPPPITQNPSFLPKDIKDDTLSINEGSHSVVKSELETNHTEDNTKFQNIPSADNLSINVKPHVIILESAPVSAEASPAKAQESGPAHVPVASTLKKKDPAQIIENRSKVDINSIPVIIIKETFNFLNNITKDPLGIMWGLLMIFMCQLALSQVATVPSMDGSTQASIPASIPLLDSASSTILYQAISMETQNFIFRLDKVEEGIVTGLSSSCSAIQTLT